MSVALYQQSVRVRLACRCCCVRIPLKHDRNEPTKKPTSQPPRQPTESSKKATNRPTDQPSKQASKQSSTGQLMSLVVKDSYGFHSIKKRKSKYPELENVWTLEAHACPQNLQEATKSFLDHSTDRIGSI